MCWADENVESSLRRDTCPPMHDDTFCNLLVSFCMLLTNRSLVANLSAANKFDPVHLSTEKAKNMVESARFFYIAGFFLTVSVDAIVTVAKHAVEKSKVNVRGKNGAPGCVYGR